MTWIYWEMADNCSSNNLLNSSKQPQLPVLTKPMNILPMALKSMPSSQLKTNTCLPITWPNALTLSVLPVPAGP